MITSIRATIDTDGSGVGAWTDAVRRHGRLLAIGVAYHASIDAGTDVTVTCTSAIGATQTLLFTENNKTDAWYYPRAATTTAALVAITNSFTEIVFDGTFAIAVAQAGATPRTPGVTVDIVFET